MCVIDSYVGMLEGDNCDDRSTRDCRERDEKEQEITSPPKQRALAISGLRNSSGVSGGRRRAGTRIAPHCPSATRLRHTPPPVCRPLSPVGLAYGVSPERTTPPPRTFRFVVKFRSHWW